jgi:hypothetical protein
VPEWIDVSVIGTTGAFTLLELVCCGRFTANDDILYHQHQGRRPFQVVGPTLPVGYLDGQRFSIYDRTECWSAQELERLDRHRLKVWSLELIGEAATDTSLRNLPELSRMEFSS